MISIPSPFETYLAEIADKRSHIWLEELQPCAGDHTLSIPRGEYDGTDPIKLKVIRGKAWTDVTWSCFYPLVSQSVLTALITNSITGWRAYPTEIVNGPQPSEERFALGITGRCSEITFDTKDPDNWVVRKNSIGILERSAKLKVDMSKWDGSDIFMSETYNRTIKCVTNRFVAIFAESRAAGIRFVPAAEAEMFFEVVR